MKDIFLKDMESQWNDHFHMRDQTWKTLQYTILIFLGVVALDFKGNIDPDILQFGYVAVLVTSALGLIVAFHHRNRQKLKFELILFYEEKLGLTPLIDPILKRHKSGFINWVNTSTYICVAQLGLFMISMFMLIYNLL